MTDSLKDLTRLANELTDRMARSRIECGDLEALARKVLESEKRRLQTVQGMLSLYRPSESSNSDIDNDSESDSDSESDLESFDSENTSRHDTDPGTQSDTMNVSASESENGGVPTHNRPAPTSHKDLLRENIRLKIELERLQHMDSQAMNLTHQYEMVISNIKNTMESFEIDFASSLDWIRQKYRARISSQTVANNHLAARYQNMLRGLLHLRESLRNANQEVNNTIRDLRLETVEQQLHLDEVE